MRHIGLTGGIGSGKSTVAALWVECGATLIDTDAIARSLTTPGGAAIAPLAAAFGPDLIAVDGGLDRDRMRHQAFADPAVRSRLEAIVHPLIALECQRQADAAQGTAIVFDVPLLVESAHWRERVDRILVVDTRQETQVQRVMARSDWSRETVLAVIASQASRVTRRGAADAVIFNDERTLTELRADIHALWHQWCGPAAR